MTIMMKMMTVTMMMLLKLLLLLMAVVLLLLVVMMVVILLPRSAVAFAIQSPLAIPRFSELFWVGYATFRTATRAGLA